MRVGAFESIVFALIGLALMLLPLWVPATTGAMVLLPALLAVSARLQRWPYAAGAAAGVGLILHFVFQPAGVSMGTVAVLDLCGLALGTALSRKASAGVALSITAAVAVLGTVTLGVAVHLGTPALDPLHQMAGVLREQATLLPAGTEANVLLAAAETLEALLPAFLLTDAAVLTGVSFGLAYLLLRLLRLQPPRLPAFRLWRLPRSVAWIYLGVTLVTLFVGGTQGVLTALLSNLSLLAGLALAVDGSAALWGWLQWGQAHPRPWRVVIFVLILLAVPFFLPWMGLVDLLFRLPRVREDLPPR
ncbi:MAG: DUF2232 domain-containing protein [Firmicutes bacterium]|nr:DUF2232 domain-containing protein [Bacillota bacterium]